MAEKSFKKPAKEKKEKDTVEAFLTKPTQKEIPMPAPAMDETETRTKRFNCVLRPSLHKQMKKVAYMEQRSVSNMVEAAVEEYVNSRASLIYQYNMQELTKKK